MNAELFNGKKSTSVMVCFDMIMDSVSAIEAFKKTVDIGSANGFYIESIDTELGKVINNELRNKAMVHFRKIKPNASRR